MNWMKIVSPVPKLIQLKSFMKFGEVKVPRSGFRDVQLKPFKLKVLTLKALTASRKSKNFLVNFF